MKVGLLLLLIGATSLCESVAARHARGSISSSVGRSNSSRSSSSYRRVLKNKSNDDDDEDDGKGKSDKSLKMMKEKMDNGMMMKQRKDMGEFTDRPSVFYGERPSAAPVTAAPITPAPVTAAPITPAPVTPAPVTAAPITPAPVAPVTAAPVTPAPVTPAPVTAAPVTPAPVTSAPVDPLTPAPVTAAPVTEAPVTSAPVTEAPVTSAPVTEAPVTEAPVTEAPVTAAPVTEAPVTPITEAPVSAEDTTAPVVAPIPPSPGFPACNICGGTLRVTLPDVVVDIPTFEPTTCGTFQTAGDRGFIEEQFCDLVAGFTGPCGCAEPGTPVAPVSAAPTDAPVTAAPVLVPDTAAPVSPAPVAAPAAAPIPPSPGFPECSVCGPGLRVTLPDVMLNIPTFGDTTCGVFETAGLTGFIEEQFCPLVTSFAAPCGCAPI